MGFKVGVFQKQNLHQGLWWRQFTWEICQEAPGGKWGSRVRKERKWTNGCYYEQLRLRPAGSLWGMECVPLEQQKSGLFIHQLLLSIISLRALTYFWGPQIASTSEHTPTPWECPQLQSSGLHGRGECRENVESIDSIYYMWRECREHLLHLETKCSRQPPDGKSLPSDCRSHETEPLA